LRACPAREDRSLSGSSPRKYTWGDECGA
jgi:hypothetical protein